MTNVHMNDTFDSNFNLNEGIKVNMFPSFRKDSMNFDELNRKLSPFSKKIEKEIKKDIVKEKNEHLKNTTKSTKVKLDPKMYRITYEEFKKNQIKGTQSNLMRGLSAHQRILFQGKATKTEGNHITIPNSNIKERTNSENNKRDNAIFTAKNIKGKSIMINNKTQEKINNNIKPISIGINNLNEGKVDILPLPEKEEEELDPIKAKEKDNITNINNLFKQSYKQAKEQCLYCLQACCNPMTLKCSHIICSSCIEENAKILSLINPLISLNNQSFIFKCPKCNDQSSLIFPSLPLPLIPSQGNPSISSHRLPKCSFCQISSVEYDCLNCDTAICSQCKIIHLSNPLTQKHKIVSYESPNKTVQDITKCPIHQATYEFFCLNEQCLICPKCAELLHKEHYYKQLWEVDSFFHNLLLKEINTSNSIVNRITIELNTLDTITSHLTNECDYYSKEALKYFDSIMKIVQSHQALMINRIKEWFKIRKGEVNCIISQLTLIKKRYLTFINYHPCSNLEKMQQIRNINTLNDNITKFNFDTLKRYTLYSYRKYSHFRNDPIKSIQHSLNKFSFLPLNINDFDSLFQCFNGSNIITKEFITSNLLIILPKITEGKLLYKISEIGPSPKAFHEACDYKGATIILVKTDTGHIFGGFNPIDWKNQFSYDECEASFIFSITDGKIRKPMRCKIKKGMKEYAIKQNDKEYSPGFGMSDNSDLFIAFKQLNNSYSKLGNVYKCPKGYQGSTFLAGKSDNWTIVDCEVYGIKYLNDNDYYLMH